MTTVGAHFDALTLDQRQSKTDRWQRMVSPRAQQAVLCSVDTATVVITSLIAFAARGLLPFGDPIASANIFTATVAIGIVWVLGMAAFGVYAIRHVRAGATEYKRVITASATVAGAVGIICYLLDVDYPRGIFILWFALGTLGMVVSRFTRRQVMHRLHLRGHLQTPVLVAGADHHVDAIAGVLRRENWLGYRVAGAITREHLTETATGLPVLGNLDKLVDVIAEHRIDTVIFAEGSFNSPDEFRRLAWKLEDHDTQIIVVPTLTDVGSHRLDVRPLAGLPLVDVDRPQAIEAGRWIKRAFDIVGAGVLLVLASPILLATAIAIKLEDGGPVLFKQPRVGLKGEEFFCLKFRSMCTDAEAKLAELQAQNEGAGVLFKMTNDPRITKVGKFIRRFSIDELPQLWNAFRGDMSLVGPRPALPREVAQYDSDTMRRLDVRPGLTGLWQVSGRSNLSWEDTVRLDLYYVDNWSMTQDLMILAKTAKAVVGSDGAY
ncbi:MAG: sugar transferase [Propionicimonas sp.]|nr:sugar transferase [Propionicimonas sp.]MEA5116803.1 sugar transferase [Propionicimonas sp.]